MLIALLHWSFVFLFIAFTRPLTPSWKAGATQLILVSSGPSSGPDTHWRPLHICGIKVNPNKLDNHTLCHHAEPYGRQSTEDGREMLLVPLS